MGQSTSTVSSNTSATPQFNSEKDVIIWFDKKAIKSLTSPELVSFKANINGKDLSDVVTSDELLKVLRLDGVNETVSSLIFNCVQTLSNFPFIRDCYENITYSGLLKSCVLLNKARCLSYVKNKRYDHTKLVYISLALNKTVKEVSSSSNSQESLDAPRIIATFNSVCVEELTVPSEVMLEFITLMLKMSKSTIIKNSKLDPNVSEGWESFRPFALSILRTMNTNIATQNDLLKYGITFSQFQSTISTVCPNLLLPFESLMEHVLFLGRDLVDIDASQPPLLESKLVSEPLLAQLATVWPRELVFSRLQKLYVGRDSGFSMRSFQAKAFKWMAPSILLIHGVRIPNDEEYAKSKNHRYKNFLEEYPRLKEEDQVLLPPFSGKKKLASVRSICQRTMESHKFRVIW